jgi:hypothetical protein
MRVAGLALATCALVTCLTGAARAQTAPLPAAAGDRVRVSILVREPGAPGADSLAPLGIHSGDRVVGTLLALRAEALDLRVDDAERRIPRSVISQLEISQGTYSHKRRGALIGFLAGGIGGAVTGAIVGRGENFGETGGDPKKVFSVAFGIGGALVGAGLGALIGARIHTERWQTVPLE